jgi:hypothetical protein
MNKRGADITTVMIFLVVGLVVGVLLIWGFATNWSIFSTLFSPGDNVNIISTQCQTACASSDTYGFCNSQRTLKATDLPLDADGKPQKQVTNTCHFFATDSDYLKYGISECSPVSCS